MLGVTRRKILVWDLCRQGVDMPIMAIDLNVNAEEQCRVHDGTNPDDGGDDTDDFTPYEVKSHACRDGNTVKVGVLYHA